jgi:hypothetical protein
MMGFAKSFKLTAASPDAEISLTSRRHSETCLAAFSRDGENGLASLTAAILSREAKFPYGFQFTLPF